MDFVMKFLIEVDVVLYKSVEHSIIFLESEFDWKQKWIERVLMLVVTVGFLWRAAHLPSIWHLMAPFVIAWTMFASHKLPGMVRRALGRTHVALIFRLIMIWLAVVTVIMLCITPATSEDVEYLALVICYDILSYMFLIPWDDEGKRKRRKKLSMERVISLFGTSWVEQPVGAH